MPAASRFITPSLLFSGLDFIGDACSCFAGLSHLSSSGAWSSCGFLTDVMYAAFSCSSSEEVLRVIRGTAFAWFVLSLSARLSGLLGEILRVAGRKLGLRLTGCLVFGASVDESTLYPRDKSEGDAGALGEWFALGDFGEVMM